MPRHLVLPISLVAVACAACAALLFGVTRLNARESTQLATDPAHATGTVVSPEHVAPTPVDSGTPHAQTENVGSEAIRPTLVAPPNQPTYTDEDVIAYLTQAGILEPVGSRPPTTIDAITFMTADAAGALFNTPVPRPGTFPVCVVSLRGEFHFGVPQGAGRGISHEQHIIYDGITGNLLIAIGGRGR